MQFYTEEPTARTSWRLAILMGANSRTYKFALGAALLEAASSGRDAVPLTELASSYAMHLVQRSGGYPQAPSAGELGDADFLSILARERAQSALSGRPTDALLDAAVRSMQSMVMQKFHNLRGVGEVPHTFYELEGWGSDRLVRLKPDLTTLSGADDVLSGELDSRWSIVETSFDAGIGRGLIGGGVELGAGGLTLVSPVRRVTLTSVRPAIAGFQHGRCFYCHQRLEDLDVDVHVDHVFPFVWMNTGSWRGPNLDHVWNLVLACAPCNLRKSARLPSTDELERLVFRNDAIAGSPHPLRRTLEITMKAGGGSTFSRQEKRRKFVRDVATLVTDG